MQRKEGRGSLFDARWGVILVCLLGLIGAAWALDSVLAPYLGSFDAQSAAIAGAIFVAVGLLLKFLTGSGGR